MLLKLYLLKSNGHVLSDLLKYEISFAFYVFTYVSIVYIILKLRIIDWAKL